MNSPPTPSPPEGQNSPLPETESLYRSAFTSAIEGMAISEHGLILDFNTEALRIFGYTKDELVGTDLARLVAPESRNAVIAAISKKQNAVYELCFLRKDGSRFDAEAQGKVINFEGRNVRLTILRDITLRRRNEESLHDSQIKLKLAMGMARLGHWELDLSTNCFLFDDNFLRLLGTSAEHEGGHTMSAEEYARRFIPPEDMPLVGREINAAITTTDPNYQHQIEHQFTRTDGTQGIMLVHIAVVKDTAGKTIRSFGVNQDITEQRQAEQQRIRLEDQLQQAQKMEALGTLAGGIAHDFNNILTGILGQLQLAELDIEANHPARNSLAEASKAGQRARTLVSRILAFSRQSAHDRKSVSLGPVVQEVMQLLRASLPATIEIHTTIAPDCPPATCESAQIHQILMNLGTNAAHAMRQSSGILTVSLGKVTPSAALQKQHPQVLPKHTLRLSVRDNGRGMDAAVLKRIYEPFFTTKDTGEGTGLGLTMVYNIMQDHDGAIVVESKPGEGTVFDLYFTPSESAAQLSAPPFPVASSSSNPFGRDRRIMIVDDDDAVRAVGANMVSRLGFTPVIYSSPVQALIAFRAAPDDVCAVLSDLTMPGMTGVALAQQIAVIRPSLPLILTTGYLNPRNRTDAEFSGVKYFIQKPFQMDELAKLLRRVLDETTA